MLRLWIEENKMEKADYPNKMEFYEFQEIIEITPEIKRDISKRVLLGLASPKHLKVRFNNLSSEEIRACLIGSILPKKDAMFYPQKSMWGEIISAEILNVFRKHLIPFYRLRHKEKQNQSMRGEADVVTCYLDENPLIIAFTEVKTKGDIKRNGYYEYKKEMQNAEKLLNFIIHHSDFLDENQLHSICIAAITNKQIYNAHICREPLKQIMSENKELIDDDLYQEVFKKIN